MIDALEAADGENPIKTIICDWFGSHLVECSSLELPLVFDNLSRISHLRDQFRTVHAPTGKAPHVTSRVKPVKMINVVAPCQRANNKILFTSTFHFYQHQMGFLLTHNRTHFFRLRVHFNSHIHVVSPQVSVAEHVTSWTTCGKRLLICTATCFVAAQTAGRLRFHKMVHFEFYEMNRRMEQHAITRAYWFSLPKNL